MNAMTNTAKAAAATAAAKTFTRVIDAHWANVGDNLRVRRALPVGEQKSLGPWVFHWRPIHAGRVCRRTRTQGSRR
ncbi:MAG: hypothetical protein ABL931_14115 [Usitatibacteraceae bacterium]